MDGPGVHPPHLCLHHPIHARLRQNQVRGGGGDELRWVSEEGCGGGRGGLRWVGEEGGGGGRGGLRWVGEEGCGGGRGGLRWVGEEGCGGGRGGLRWVGEEGCDGGRGGLRWVGEEGCGGGQGGLRWVTHSTLPVLRYGCDLEGVCAGWCDCRPEEGGWHGRMGVCFRLTARSALHRWCGWWV